MLSSVENAFVGRDEKHALLEMPVWEAGFAWFLVILSTAGSSLLIDNSLIRRTP